jgi:hypothetical protein
MKKVISLGALALMFSTAIFAQGSAGLGAVTGTVRDASGSVVPDAEVVITDTATGARRGTRTTGAGVFNAPALVPAPTYSITVTKGGFATYEIKKFDVPVGVTVDLHVNLQISGTATTVDITDTAPLVDDTKSGVSQVIDTQQIDNLPINGRRADTFALLTPAVVADGTFGLITFRGISASNAFLTDGNYTSNSFYMENAGRTRISTQISQDAVQEFQVLSDGFSAEFGRAMGGIINTVTRSGTNTYHGTAFEFFRNRTLDAIDRYAPPGINPPEWRHQAGGTFSGPIKKDKVFFLLNTEIVKRNFPGINRITSTQIADATGNFVNPANCVTNTAIATHATAAQCAAAAAFIQPQMNVLVPRTVSSVMGFGKLDYRMSDKDSFSFDLNAMHWRSPNGIQTQGVLTNGNMLGGNANSTVETRYGKASWTRIVSAEALNQMQFGWFKDRLADPSNSSLFPSTGPLAISLVGAAIGAPQAYPRVFPSEQRFQVLDNFSLTRGSHSFKVGVDFDRTEDYIKQLFNFAGGYTYNSLTQFAEDFTGNTTGAKNYSAFSQQFGNPVQDLLTKSLNFYAQDTWKLSRQVTFNYGVRYEKQFLPQPTLKDANYPLTGNIPSASHNFAPRASIAFAANEKTVLRAGFGLFYAPLAGDGLDTLFLGNGLYQTSISVNPTQTGAPVFPNIVPSASAVPAGTSNLTFAAPNFHNPYTEQGTLAIERQIGSNMSFTASYIYNHGVGLITSRDVNIGGPTGTFTYSILNIAGAQVGSFTTPIWGPASKLDSRYGHIFQVENGGNSTYNGLALQFVRRYSHGVTFQAAYTYSHAIDDAQQSGGSTVIAYTQSNTYPNSYSADKGSSGTDQRHRAVINWTWAPTITHSNSMFAKYFVNGWQLSSITTLASSQPTSATISGTQLTGGLLLYTNSLNGSGGWSRAPFLPVNSVDIDREYRVDARLSREIAVTERVKAWLIFEGFNVFNTQYNTSVSTAAYTSSAAGVLKPVTTVNTLGQTVTSLGFGTATQAFPDGTNARRLQVALRLVF